MPTTFSTVESNICLVCAVWWSVCEDVGVRRRSQRATVRRALDDVFVDPSTPASTATGFYTQLCLSVCLSVCLSLSLARSYCVLNGLYFMLLCLLFVFNGPTSRQVILESTALIFTKFS